MKADLVKQLLLAAAERTKRIKAQNELVEMRGNIRVHVCGLNCHHPAFLFSYLELFSGSCVKHLSPGVEGTRRRA